MEDIGSTLPFGLSGLGSAGVSAASGKGKYLYESHTNLFNRKTYLVIHDH